MTLIEWILAYLSLSAAVGVLFGLVASIASRDD